jgi:hypothetical protein
MHAPGALNLAAISFEFAARSNAQKCRALQPNGEKRSHGVDSCSPSFASPTTISTKSPFPISLRQQDHRVASPSLTGSSRCRLQVIFSGISAQGITSGGSQILVCFYRGAHLIQSLPDVDPSLC